MTLFQGWSERMGGWDGIRRLIAQAKPRTFVAEKSIFLRPKVFGWEYVMKSGPRGSELLSYPGRRRG